MARLKFHPRSWLDSLLTYPRFIGTIKPELLGHCASELAPRLEMHQAAWWPKRLEFPVARRLLAISPHPDDEAIGCGGILLAHAGKAEICIVNVYNGDGGGALEDGVWHNDPDYKARLVAMRQRELDRVAETLQATQVTRFGISDCNGVPGKTEVVALRRVLREFAPEVVLLPWLLDTHPHHKATNQIFSEAVQDLDVLVLAYEIWGLLSPNAFFDITDLLDRKLQLIALYTSQVRTVDYIGYAEGLARVRAFHHPVRDRRVGAVEAYFALPSRDYCQLTRHALARHRVTNFNASP